MKIVLLITIFLGIAYFIWSRFFRKKSLLLQIFDIMQTGHDTYAEEFINKNEKEILKTSPATIVTLLKAIVLYRLKKDNEAIVLCKLIETSCQIKNDNNNPFLYYSYFLRAKLALRSEEDKEALNLLNKVIAFEPNHGRSYIFRGAAHGRLGDKKSAYNDVVTGERLKNEARNKTKNIDLLSNLDNIITPPAFAVSQYSEFQETLMIQSLLQQYNS